MKRLKLIFSLGLRNLVRQKRRNVLLGIAIAFGTMILITANSFSAGLTDILLNKLVVQITGHVEIAVMEKSRAQNTVMRDQKFFRTAVSQNLTGVKEISENTAIFSRVLGNNKGENMIIVPVHLEKTNDLIPADIEYLAGRQAQGNVHDLLSEKYENPVAIYREKAKVLKINLYDTLRAKLKTVSGQQQSARFTVVAILKSESLFDSGVLFIPLKNLKTIRGFRPNESGTLQINFSDISDTSKIIRQADTLQAWFKPQTAMIEHQFICRKKTMEKVVSMGFLQSHWENTDFHKKFRITKGKFPQYKDIENIVISEGVASQSGCKVNDVVQLIHKSVHEKELVLNSMKISGIYQAPADFPAGILFPEAGFYRVYLNDLPEKRVFAHNAKRPLASEYISVFAPEYKILPRSRTADEMLKKMQDLRKTGYFGPAVDVRTMYESASQVLELEKTLFIITFVAGLILFFIIIIGVINTLRMTIRERTREIGTMRALGMQQNDIKNIFLAETTLLTAISAVAGFFLAAVLIFFLSQFTIETESVLGMFLHKKRLYFLMQPSSIALNLCIILLISLTTAYFPSKRAAKLSAADALRHYD